MVTGGGVGHFGSCVGHGYEAAILHVAFLGLIFGRDFLYPTHWVQSNGPWHQQNEDDSE